jgi:hypothetical protein
MIVREVKLEEILEWKNPLNLSGFLFYFNSE